MINMLQVSGENSCEGGLVKSQRDLNFFFASFLLSDILHFFSFFLSCMALIDFCAKKIFEPANVLIFLFCPMLGCPLLFFIVFSYHKPRICESVWRLVFIHFNLNKGKISMGLHIDYTNIIYIRRNESCLQFVWKTFLSNRKMYLIA